MFRFLFNCLLIVIFSSLHSNASGQNKKCVLPIYNTSDTSIWYKTKQADAKKMGLTDLTKSIDSLHIRFWTETQIVEIWTTDYKKFYGYEINYTRSINNDRLIKGSTNYKPSLLFHKVQSIDSSKSMAIYQLFKFYTIENIPNGDSIINWNEGVDGSEIIIEWSTNKHYSFKEYWNPSEFATIPEAVRINKFTLQMQTFLDSKESWKKFIKGLPNGCYRAGGLLQECN